MSIKYGKIDKISIANIGLIKKYLKSPRLDVDEYKNFEWRVLNLFKILLRVINKRLTA
jgi:hypothetical protein